MMKALIAAIGGSAIAALAVCVALTIYNIIASAGQTLDFLSAMFWFLMLSFFCSAVVACTLGMFWHSVAYKLGWSSVHVYWPPAVLLGITPPVLLMTPQLLADLEGGVALTTALRGLVTMATLGAALSGLTAVFAWLIRRPDRDAPNPTTPAP